MTDKAQVYAALRSEIEKMQASVASLERGTDQLREALRVYRRTLARRRAALRAAGKHYRAAGTMRIDGKPRRPWS